MYRVPPDRASWAAVGAPLERRVRPHALHAYGVAKLDVADWLPAAHGNVLWRQFMKPDQDAGSWDTKCLQTLHEQLVQPALCPNRATGKQEDADVREALWLKTVCSPQEPMRRMNHQRDVAMDWRNRKGLNNGAVDRIKDADFLVLRVASTDFNGCAWHGDCRQEKVPCILAGTTTAGSL